jgi:alpha-N-arabinofuranosidase
MIYLKVVNAAPVAQSLLVDLRGGPSLLPRGKAVTIGSDNPEETNTITDPRKIVPVTTELSGLKKQFRHVFPPNSVTVLELQVKQ